MSESCWHCRYAEVVGQQTVRHLILSRGYIDRHADERGSAAKGENMSVICPEARTVNSVPCKRLEREVGADDE